MARVMSIMPPFYRLVGSKNNRVMPAMHYIAEVAKEEGHEACYYNADFSATEPYADRYSITMNDWMYKVAIEKGHKSFEDAAKAISDWKPDVIVIGAGDILLATVDLGAADTAAKTARIAKEVCPEAFIVGYGHLLDHAPESIRDDFDCIIKGEAEGVINRVIEERPKGVVEGVYERNLDSMPFLTAETLHPAFTPEAKDWDYIISQRGCPFRCTFCYQPTLRGRKVGGMSADRFVDEIEYRIKELGTRSFYVSDMIFPLKKVVTLKKLEGMKRLKQEYPDFNWWAEARVDSADETVMMEMAAAGCTHLKFGVEMANNEMLKVINKGIDLEKVKAGFDLAKKAGIKQIVYVLLGCPGFNDQDYLDMLPYFEELQADSYIVSINVPYKGTAIYDQIEDDLKASGLFCDGEEGFKHTSLEMMQYWGISQETFDKYMALGSCKEDGYRKYERIVIKTDLGVDNG